MGRKQTYERNALDDMFDEFENDDIQAEQLDVKVPESKNEDTTIEETKSEPEEKLETPTKSKPKKRSTTKPKSRKKKSPPINFKKKEPTSVTRSFRISPELDGLINDMVSDGKGKKISGSRGFLKVFAHNALIREMVELGFVDESYLENLIPYDEI